MKVKTKIAISIIFLSIASYFISPTFIKQDKSFEVGLVEKAFAEKKVDYVCCSPFSVECVVGQHFTVWGTLTQGTKCPVEPE